jgi:hypothetical protein
MKGLRKSITGKLPVLQPIEYKVEDLKKINILQRKMSKKRLTKDDLLLSQNSKINMQVNRLENELVEHTQIYTNPTAGLLKI